MELDLYSAYISCAWGWLSAPLASAVVYWLATGVILRLGNAVHLLPDRLRASDNWISNGRSAMRCKAIPQTTASKYTD